MILSLRHAALCGLLSATALTAVAQVAATKPDDDRFTPVVLAEPLDEPMEFEVRPDGRVYFVERKGAFKMYDPTTKEVTIIATIDVNTKYTSAEGVVREAEEGLMGFTFDPQFDTNHFVYLYYAHPTEKKHILTRWQLINNELIAASEKVVLEVATQREVCCHTGGGMTWDSAGNLYLTTGNNTGNEQAAQTDERPGRSSWDDQRSAGNTNDLRGKILRIKPQPDGTYTIPEGNLFAPGTAKTRPEIYVMGNRNAWRPSIDSLTGWLYWGEVGPDATEDSDIGPRGYDEFNQARSAGNYGWPWFVGENQAFPIYDYGKNEPVPNSYKNPARPTNTSPNNSGLTELPPARPAFIAYPYGFSDKYPLMGSGSRSAVGGPVYRRADFANPVRPWPAYFEGKWIITDFTRNWILAVSMDEKGDYKSMERLVPHYRPVEPIDIGFGPDGDLYVLEYGSAWFRGNPDARLVKIEYNAGNRPPHAEASASSTGGALPFRVTLSADGTRDADGDALSYEWTITPQAGGAAQVVTGANPTVTLDRAGLYTAALKVTDAQGATASSTLALTAGNALPQVSVTLARSNQSFYFPGESIRYQVGVIDQEDGSLGDGRITPAQVSVRADYLPVGYEYATVARYRRSVDVTVRTAVAEAIMATSDCRVCHQVNTASAGPSYTQIAEKYRDDPKALEVLSRKVIAGGGGVWGEVQMPAHPGITANEANALVRYILGVTESPASTLPVEGTLATTIPPGDNGQGAYVLRASYQDRGAAGVPALFNEQVIVLRNPRVVAASASEIVNSEILWDRGQRVDTVLPRNGGHIGFKGVDLTGITQIEMTAVAAARAGTVGGRVEIRLGSPTGRVVGSVDVKRAAVAPPGGAQAVQNAGGAAPAAAAAAPAIPAAPTAAVAVTPPAGGGGGGRGRGAPPVLVSTPGLSGVHDIYFTFTNAEAKPAEPLLTLTSITYKK